METPSKVNRKIRLAPDPAAEGPEAAPPPARRRRDPDAAALRRPPSRLLLAALFFLALALVPAVPGTVRALRLVVLFSSSAPEKAFLGLPVPCTAFLGGFLAFCAVFATRKIPSSAYVAVHETTHALFGLAFGAKISRFRVGSDSGSVDVSRRNAAILLAPYFFPLPLVAVLAVFGLVSIFVPLAETAAGTAAAAAAGAAWGFHFCFTVNALLQYQTDLDAYGFFFSAVALALLNLAVLGLALVALSPVTFSDFAAAESRSVAEAYLWTIDLARGA